MKLRSSAHRNTCWTSAQKSFMDPPASFVPVQNTGICFYFICCLKFNFAYLVKDPVGARQPGAQDDDDEEEKNLREEEEAGSRRRDVHRTRTPSTHLTFPPLTSTVSHQRRNTLLQLHLNEGFQAETLKYSKSNRCIQRSRFTSVGGLSGAELWQN